MFRFLAAARYYLVQSVRTGSGAVSAACLMDTGVEEKRLGREACQSPPFVA